MHVHEVVPGAGLMDYVTVLRRLNALDRDVTLRVEHFGFEDTVQGVRHIRQVTRDTGIILG